MTTDLFCTSQVLSLLHPPAGADVKPYLSGDRHWEERHIGRGGEELEGKNPWRRIRRQGENSLLERLSAKGDIRRLAVVCSGGYGKSANLEYLAAMLTTVGLVPFHFELDERKQSLPNNLRDFWTETLPCMFSQGKNDELKNDRKKAQHILKKCKDNGRLVLLFDSIDQATGDALQLVEQVLADPAWSGCPVVISGRPDAIWHDWDKLIKPDATTWHFLRVEPLAEPERHLLLGPNIRDQTERRRIGWKRYNRLPAEGRQLMANPRHIEYVRRCASRVKHNEAEAEPDCLTDFTLEDLRTASHLFAGAIDHDVRLGFKAAGTRELGRNRNRRIAATDVDFALDLMAAFAYAMYSLPHPAWNGRGTFRPNVSRVPQKEMGGLIADVVDLLKSAGVVKPEYGETELENVDLPALNALNAGAKFDLFDRELRRRGDFRWHDRTLQEFLAAWWLAKYADGPEVKRLRSWRYDNRMREAKSLYAPLWGFLVEMPRAVRTEKWFAAVGVLFEHGATRCCEMIYRCCQTFELMNGREKQNADAMMKSWQQEFIDLREKDTGERGEVARGLWGSLKPCPPDQKDGLVTFQMGSPESEKGHRDNEIQHEVMLTPFRISRAPVTNAEYELFDPDHEEERRWKEEPDIARHPVMKVDWFEAWCYCRWVGGRLPTEAEWEYACRGGTMTTFYWGDKLNGTEANCNGYSPYGTTKEGVFNRRTTAVGEYEKVSPHPWGLVDVHGNVCEWCGDWYDSDSYPYPDEAVVKDPVGPKHGSDRVCRGGGWCSFATSCRSASRDCYSPGQRGGESGFRLAADPLVVFIPGR